MHCTRIQLIAEHHVGLVPVVHKRVPNPFAQCPLGSKTAHLVPLPFKDRRGTPRHHPTRLRRLVELAIPRAAKRSMYHVLVRLLCRVGNIRSAHVVPKRAEQTDHVLLPPLMPRTFLKRTHEKHILYPSVHGNMRTCNRSPIRCIYITRPGSEGASTAASASILRCYGAAAAATAAATAAAATAAVALFDFSSSCVIVFVFRQ